MRDNSLQTVNDISIDVGYSYEQVEQEVAYLDEKELLIEAKIDQYSLTRKGYAALRRHTADVS